MRIIGKLGAASALAAMALCAVPAQAQWHGPRHRGHDRIDGGDVLLGAVLAGGLFALLSSARHHDAPSPPVEDVPPPPPPVVQPTGTGEGVAPAGRRVESDQDAAVDACVSSAESEGRHYARIAKIDTVNGIDADGAGWMVRGTLVLRDDYRQSRGDRRGFSCRVGDKGVEGVMVDGGRTSGQ
jgi:hypothetical protein